MLNWPGGMPVVLGSLALGGLLVGCSSEGPPTPDLPPVQSPPMQTVANLVIRPEIHVVDGGPEGDSLRVTLTLFRTGKHSLQLEASACGKSEGKEQLDVGEWLDTSWGYSLRSRTQWIPGNPDTLRLGVSLANRTSRPIQFELGCGTLVRAYRTAERTGPPAWDLARAMAIACGDAQGTRRTLAPGDTVPAEIWTVELPEPSRILGDTLPAGRYFFSISPPLELNPAVDWPPPHPTERGPSYTPSPPVRISLRAGTLEL